MAIGPDYSVRPYADKYARDETPVSESDLRSIQKMADNVDSKKWGIDTRYSISSSMRLMDEVIKDTLGRQDEVEDQFQDVIENTTDKDVISAPEIIAARNGESNLKARLDKENQEITAQLAQNALKEVSEISVSDFGALGSSTPTPLVDEGTQIVEAFKYAIANDIRIVKFPNNYYRTSKKIPILHNRISILGIDSNTVIEYVASEDGNFIEAPRTETLVKNIDLRITSGNYRTVGIEAYRGNRTAWGGKITTENVVIQGYTDAGIRVHAPYRTWIKDTYINGGDQLQYNSTGDNRPPVTNKIGIDFIGTNVFGNVNTIENSRVQLNRYGLKLLNVGSTTVTNGTFEHNWVHISSYTPENATSGMWYTSNNTVINSWFENSVTLGNHSRPDGSIVTYEVDEITGEQKTITGRQGEIILFGSQIHDATNKIDTKNNTPYIYSPNRAVGGTTVEMNAHNKPVWQWTTNTFGPMIQFGPDEAYFRMPVTTRNSFKQMSTNKIDDSVRYEVRSRTQYNTGGANSNLFTTVLGAITKEPNTIYKLKAFTHIYASGGNPVYVESHLIIDGNLIRNQKSEVLDGIYALEIDENNQGVKLVFEDDIIKAEIKATNALHAKISLEIKAHTFTP